MPERPLLLFPTPEVTSKSNLGGGGGRPHLPTHFRQGERLAPKFTQLQEAVRTRNIEIQQAVTGIDPEQVLVMETIGSVEDFANAVKRIDGFEWMGEFEIVIETERPVERPDLAMDTPVWVRNEDNEPWEPRHFAEWCGNLMVCWEDGTTSHSSEGTNAFWKYWRLDDPAKEAIDK